MTGAAAPADLPPIATRPIPSTGEPLPVIGLGTYDVFDVDATPAAQAPLVDVLSAFCAQGARVVDSSPMYGRAEATVGTVATAVRGADQLFYATKVWTHGADTGIREMERSCRRLRVTRLDLMQVHNLVDWRTHLPALNAWRDAGRIRYLGITHYHAGAHAELARVMRTRQFDCVQINYSILEREAEETVLPLAAELGMAVIVNRPFAQGALCRRMQGVPLPGWAKEIGCTSWAQMFLKYILGHPAVTCVIPATGDPNHLADNLAAGRGGWPDATLRRRMVEAIAAR